MYTKYPNRWNPDLGWIKLLPRQDKQLQVSELHEIQSILISEIQGPSSYLYDFYSITQGLQISVLELSDNYNLVRLGYGQVYVETPQGGLYVDIEGIDRLPIPNKGRVSIGLSFDFLYEENLPDPLTHFSKGGADRLSISYEVVVDQDSYPIAVIDNKAPFVEPDIYYYSNRGLTKLYNPAILSSTISSLLRLRWKEENGDFISDGLETLVEIDTKKVMVNAGTAYIDGTRVNLPHGAHATLPSLPTDPDTFFRYIILLNKIGEIEFIKETNPSSYMPEIYEGTIDLLAIEVTNRKLVSNQLQRDISYIPNRRRVLTNSDLLLLYKQNYENEKKLAQISLDMQSLNIATSRGLNLNGVLTDTLQDLSRSDIYHPLYSASFIPSIRAIRTGYTSSQKDALNVEMSDTDVDVIFNSAAPYYAICSYSETSLVEQSRPTNWISLSSGSRRIASLVISPSKGVSDSSTLPYSAVAPASLPTLSENILKSLSLSGDPNISLNLLLKARSIELNCTGFSPLEDNLELIFGSSLITDFTLLGNTSPGTSLNTIKAGPDGVVQLRFLIPPNLPLDTYVVSLSNSMSNAATTYNSINTIESLVNPGAITPPSVLSYSPLSEGVAQTFFIQEPSTLTSVSLMLRRVPSLTGSGIKLLRISLVKTENGVPNGDCIGIADLSLDQVSTSSNGSSWSVANFIKPVPISTRGLYAIIVTPLVQGVEAYISRVGSPSLIDGSISGEQALVNGSLFLKQEGSWQVDLSSDLTFLLKKAVMKNTRSELIFKVENDEDFDSVNFNIPYILPQGTALEFYEDSNTGWRLIRGNSYQLQSPSKLSRVKAVLFNTASLSPILELDNLMISANSNKSTSTWVSITGSFESSYNNVEISMESYKPKGTDIQVRFSSNGGLTWESTTLDDSETNIVDGNIPLYKYVFKALNLSDAVSNQSPSGASISTLRKKLTIRIDFKTNTSSVIPFVRKVSSITYST